MELSFYQQRKTNKSLVKTSTMLKQFLLYFKHSIVNTTFKRICQKRFCIPNRINFVQTFSSSNFRPLVLLETWRKVRLLVKHSLYLWMTTWIDEIGLQLLHYSFWDPVAVFIDKVETALKKNWIAVSFQLQEFFGLCRSMNHLLQTSHNMYCLLPEWVIIRIIISQDCWKRFLT